MAAKVYVKPEDLWGFIQDNADELFENAAVIAENDTEGYEICVTKEYQYSAYIIAYRGDDEIERTLVGGEQYAKSKMTDLLLKYIYPVEKDTMDNKPDKQDKDNEVSRDAEIFSAAIAFFKVLFQTENTASIIGAIGRDGVDDCVDSLCYYLSTQYGVSIYYPAETIEDDGSTSVVEYPYG